MFRTLTLVLLFTSLSFTNAGAFGQEMTFGEYLTDFDYVARKEMKIDSEALIRGLKEGKLFLVDIRFKEEFEAWRMGFAKNIPLNELPARFNELPREKTIVAACPHKDRAILAMAYLRTQGFDSQYLTDGLTGLVEYLRGDKARDFVTNGAKSKQ